MEDFPYYFIFTFISLAMLVSIILNLFLFPIFNPQSFVYFGVLMFIYEIIICLFWSPHVYLL